MGVSVETFRRVALEDDEEQWEYHCGKLVRKPAMTMAHNWHIRELGRQLNVQLDPDVYTVAENAGHMEFGGQYFVPDVAVIPLSYQDKFLALPDELEEYSDPLPFVAEVWSRSTGAYDVDTKFPAYRSRGDAEIWRLHPRERTVHAWRRQAGGGYEEVALSGPRVTIASLPGVTIDLDRIFRY
jgi:Uma2 family endonuclease